MNEHVRAGIKTSVSIALIYLCAEVISPFVEKLAPSHWVLSEIISLLIPAFVGSALLSIFWEPPQIKAVWTNKENGEELPRLIARIDDDNLTSDQVQLSLVVSSNKKLACCVLDWLSKRELTLKIQAMHAPAVFDIARCSRNSEMQDYAKPLLGAPGLSVTMWGPSPSDSSVWVWIHGNMSFMDNVKNGQWDINYSISANSWLSNLICRLVVLDAEVGKLKVESRL